MKRRNRYLFLLAGLLVFLILAPLTVFYVTGIDYNFSGDRYVQTGILAVESEPRDVQIFIDGQLRDTTPANVRFLPPGEYLVTLRKDGYFDWTKRLEIKPGLATRISQRGDEVYLLRKDGVPGTIVHSVLDYYVADGFLVYLVPGSVNIVRNGTGQVEPIHLEQSYNKITPSPNNNHFLLSGPGQEAVLTIDRLSLTELGALPASLTKTFILDDGRLLGLENDTLTSFDRTTKQKTEILTDVSSFTVLGDTLYYIQPVNGIYVLFAGNIIQPLAGRQVLFSGLPADLAAAQILVTAQKNILLYEGSNIYRINSHIEKISGDIREFQFSATDSALLYATASELYRYDFVSGQSPLITRSAVAITDPILAPDIGYAFYIHNQELQATELDNLDRQNSYMLLKGSSIKKVTINEDDKILYFMDGETLKYLEIR